MAFLVFHSLYYDNNSALSWTGFVPNMLKYRFTDSSHAILEHNSALNTLSTVVLTRRGEYQVQCIWTLLLCMGYKTWIFNGLPYMEIYGATWWREQGESPFDVDWNLPRVFLEYFSCKEHVALLFFLGGGWFSTNKELIRSEFISVKADSHFQVWA